MNNDDDDDNYPGKLLHQAALYLNVDLLKDLLTGDEINNIDATDRFGCTPLLTACISAAQATLQNDTKVLDSSLEFIMALIDHGADLNIQAGERYDYQTPLHVIAAVGNEKILALLLFHKADVTIKDKHGDTSLALAQMNRKVDTVEMIQNEIELRQQVRQETEKKLLDACFDGDVEKAAECLAHLGAHAKAVLNSSPNGSDTLNFLYRACRTGNVDLVKLLLKHGAIAKPHRQTSYSPLYIACRIGNLEIVQMLLTHFPHLVSVATLEQILPFAAACSQGHLAIVQLLLTYPNYPFASCSLFADRLQRSYVFPFNLNAQDLNDQTSLYLAALGGYIDVVEYLLSFRIHGLTAQEIELFKRRSTHSYFNSESSITTLSDFNTTLQKITSSFCPFNLDVYSNNGRAALHEAIEQQNFKLVYLLVSNGANVNLPYEEIASQVSNEEQCFVTRSTPLSCACRLGHIHLIEYLLNSHATDKEFLAYNACKQSYLIGHLLKYRVLQDNEFKLTKRQLTSNVLYPFDDKFWLVLTNFDRLRSLEIISIPFPSETDRHIDYVYSLIDRSKYLYSLSMDYLVLEELSTMSTPIKSIRRLNIMANDGHFYGSECISLIQSCFGNQCEILFINLENRTIALDIIHQMSYLRVLIFQCQDDQWEDNQETMSTTDELLPYFKQHLSSNCSILRDEHESNIIQLWIR